MPARTRIHAYTFVLTPNSPLSSLPLLLSLINTLQLSIYFAPSILLGLASTAATAVQGTVEGASWDLAQLEKFNVTSLPAIICFLAPAVHTSSSAKKASTQHPAGRDTRMDIMNAAALAWMTVDPGGGSGVDFTSIADGLHSCAVKGQSRRRYLEEYEKAMRDARDEL
jgi:hypothetical protein